MATFSYSDSTANLRRVDRAFLLWWMKIRATPLAKVEAIMAQGAA